ncbi:MAG: GNAT family N-acetyltransferase, partial [Armatimonadetes bacterium]|nr:GNAT family N-acetyltransferase [Armatimonadota bacterium]
HDFGFCVAVIPHRPAGLNQVSGCRLDEADWPSQVESVLDVFQRAGEPANWLVGPGGTPPELGRLLRRHLRMMGPVYLPAMELVLDSYKPLLTTLDVSLLVDWEDAAAPGHPATFFSTKASRLDTVATKREVEAFGNVFHVLARVGGHPASTCTAFVHEGVVGIYDVATVEDLRRQGAAAAAIDFALLRARDMGCKTAILQAHKRSVGLYDRLGFRETGMFQSLYYSRTRMEAEAVAKGYRPPGSQP